MAFDEPVQTSRSPSVGSWRDPVALLLASTGEGIYGVDLDGACVFINPAGARLIGYEPQEVIGRNMHELTHHARPDGSHYPEAECPIFNAFRQGLPCRIDSEVLWRSDGSPFSAEYSSHPILDGGVVQGYFLSSYSARKLGMKTTGNAGGAHNLTLSSRLTQQGDDLDAMLRKLHRGLFVIELIGQGVNGVTGDYSRGAAGFWVEAGRMVHPVHEITIAGNLREMLKGIVAA